MSEYVIMPSADYKAACDAVRAASGKTDLIKSGELSIEIADVIDKIGAGGGDIQLEGDFLNYVSYQLDIERQEIILCNIMYDKFYKDKGKYDINIPDTLGIYRVVIASEGVT